MQRKKHAMPRIMPCAQMLPFFRTSLSKCGRVPSGLRTPAVGIHNPTECPAFGYSWRFEFLDEVPLGQREVLGAVLRRIEGSSFSHFLQKPKRWSALTLVSYEHLLSGRYMSTHRASRSISAQAVAPSVTFLSTKQTSWVARVRSSGPVRDGETKILNAPTCKANHMIMRIRCVVCTKSKASRNCVR